MKRSTLALMILLAYAVLPALDEGGGLSLRLVEIHPAQGNAVWELRNDSLSLTTYLGTGFFLREGYPAWGAAKFDGSGWTYSHGGWCRNGFGTRLLLPKSSLRFTGFIPARNRRLAVQVKSGLVFRRTIEVRSPLLTRSAPNKSLHRTHLSPVSSDVRWL